MNKKQSTLSRKFKICFRLTKWVSNNRKVLLSILEDQRASGIKDFDLDQDSLLIERALCMQWCTEDDTFTYIIKVQEKLSRRKGILSVVNSIYDPLGFLAPLILPVKLLLICANKDMAGMMRLMTKVLISGLNDQMLNGQSSNVKFKKCLKPEKFGITLEAQLHYLSDASESVNGTATYLVLTNEQNQKSCYLLIGKLRISPLKQITFPRLELTAATTAVKIDKILKQELQMPLQPSVLTAQRCPVTLKMRVPASKPL